MIARRRVTDDVLEAAPLRCADGRPWPPPAGTPITQYPRPEVVPVDLACSICGVSTPPAGSTHPPLNGTWPAFWPGRVCRLCGPILASSDVLAAKINLVADVVAYRGPGALDVAAAVKWYSAMPGTTPYDLGAEVRWAHVDLAMVSAAAERAAASLAPEPHASGLGCGACGVRAAATWSPKLLAIRSGGWAPTCAACGDVVAVTGDSPRTADLLAAAAAGLVRPAFRDFARRIGFRLFRDAEPGGAGVDEPWAYIGIQELERLRAWAARSADAPQSRPQPVSAGLRLDGV